MKDYIIYIMFGLEWLIDMKDITIKEVIENAKISESGHGVYVLKSSYN